MTNTTIDELGTRVTALEAGHDSRLDMIAAISGDTRTAVEKMRRSMVTMIDHIAVKDRIDMIETVSKDSRSALKRLEGASKEHDQRFDKLETDVAELKGDVSTLKGDVSTLKTGMARVLEILEARAA